MEMEIVSLFVASGDGRGVIVDDNDDDVGGD